VKQVVEMDCPDEYYLSFLDFAHLCSGNLATDTEDSPDDRDQANDPHTVDSPGGILDGHPSYD